MESICLGTLDKNLFVGGSAGVKNAIASLEQLSFLVPIQDTPRFDNYINAAKRFLVKCSGFIDSIAFNKNFIIYKVMCGFVLNYPKTKQNLANMTDLTNSVINFYTMQLKNERKYLTKKELIPHVKDKDLVLKFLTDNRNNIYDTIVVITNVMRARDLIIKHSMMNK